MDMGVKISCAGVLYTRGSRGQNTMDRDHNTMGRGFDIPCVGESK